MVLIALVMIKVNAYAQDTTESNPIKCSGYVETYYCYDFNNPTNHERPSFLYNFNRHNEVNLNIGMVKASYNTENVRGNLALMAGTYPQYNLAGEQGLLRNVYEANVGVKISKNNNLWVDAGIMPSHLGFESAIGQDCWALTRSLLAENSPYYESGVKVGYKSKNEKLNLALMYLNGWQRIERISGNQIPSLGTQIAFQPNSKITFNWSTYAGNERSDKFREMRYFNNLYTQIQIVKKLGVIAGFDIGMQQIKRDTSAYNNWSTAIVIIQYKPTDKIRLAARGENYIDKKEVIIRTRTPNGFETIGYSLNLDYLITDNVMWRIEGRGFKSKDPIFTKGNNTVNENFFVTTSISISI